MALTAFPDSAWASQRRVVEDAPPPCWPVSGLTETTCVAFPDAQTRPVAGRHKRGIANSNTRPLTVAGAALVRKRPDKARFSSSFPLNCSAQKPRREHQQRRF